MSSEKQVRPSGRYYLSPEECQEMFGDFGSGPWQIDIPDHHKEILVERVTRYCKEGVEMIPLEEVEEELFDLLRKG